MPPHFVSLDPRTGDEIARFAKAGAAEVRDAFCRARAAAQKWASTAPSERVRYIRRIRQAIIRHGDRIEAAITRELGRPAQETLGADLLPTIDALAWLERNAARVLADRRTGPLRESAEPYGVVALLGTWNYPLYLNLVPLCQALAAGNVVIWKASELAPLSAQAAEEAVAEANLPSGVFQVLHGDAETGRMVVESGCDKLALIGSARTGRSVLSLLAQRGVPSVMELSGHDCAIVCVDAPLEEAARSLVWARACNAGQSCIAPQRVYVDRRIEDEFLALASCAAQSVDRAWWTPLRTAAMREEALGRVREAVTAGAHLAAGSLYAPAGTGNWMEPTVLAGCESSMRVMSEELFAPVLAIAAYGSEEEAVRLANASEYGLGASVWTSSPARGARLAEQIRAGLVSVNSVLIDAARPEVSFGGLGASGFGKMRGEAGLREFFVRKTTVCHAPGGPLRHLFPYYKAGTDLLRAQVRWRGNAGWSAFRDLAAAALAWRGEERLRLQSEQISNGKDRSAAAAAAARLGKES